MTSWPQQPIIYEINAWVWVQALSRTYGRPIDLSCVPSGEWEALAALGCDAIWLMGVWTRSPQGRAIARTNPDFLAGFQAALPDFTPDDVPGSPYCVQRYEVDDALGGRAGLAQARSELAERGLKLLLDFVPNHVAPDHPWITDHPEYFIQGTPDDLISAPTDYFEAHGRAIARGRDPYFPPWPDVAQLNAFNPLLRSAVTTTLNDIATQCDGVRCDMAMLMLTDVFTRTWGRLAGVPPAIEYWQDIIALVKHDHPEFLFIAEAYWDLEYALQQQGFDYCYDKRLFDRLEKDNAESVRLHLLADLSYQHQLVRFIENHDEPRAAASLQPIERSQAAALVVGLTPGATLWHAGQFEGRQIKPPVLLGRLPDEPINAPLQQFYRQLVHVQRQPALRTGAWTLCDRTGWRDNPSYLNVVAWGWNSAEQRVLVIINLSEYASQARVRVPWDELTGRAWTLRDAFSGEVFERHGDELRGPGLYVDLQPWQFHVLVF